MGDVSVTAVSEPYEGWQKAIGASVAGGETMTGPGAAASRERCLIALLKEQAWSIACSDAPWEGPLCDGLADFLGDETFVHIVRFAREDNWTLRLTDWVDAPARPASVASQSGSVIDIRRHPGVRAVIERGTTSPIRLSDIVDLPRFRHTEIFQRTHAYPGGTRFASAAALMSTSRELVLVGAHSTGKDFTAEHMEMLVGLQRVLAPALLIRGGLNRLARAEGESCDGLREAVSTTDPRMPPLRVVPTVQGSDEYWPTGREQQVLGLLTFGLTSQQIGRRLGITERTVRKHLESVYRKAKLPSRVAAAAWWQRRSGR